MVDDVEPGAVEVPLLGCEFFLQVLSLDSLLFLLLLPSVVLLPGLRQRMRTLFLPGLCHDKLLLDLGLADVQGLREPLCLVAQDALDAIQGVLRLLFLLLGVLDLRMLRLELDLCILDSLDLLRRLLAGGLEVEARLLCVQLGLLLGLLGGVQLKGRLLPLLQELERARFVFAEGILPADLLLLDLPQGLLLAIQPSLLQGHPGGDQGLQSRRDSLVVVLDVLPLGLELLQHPLRGVDLRLQFLDLLAQLGAGAHVGRCLVLGALDRDRALALLGLLRRQVREILGHTVQSLAHQSVRIREEVLHASGVALSVQCVCINFRTGHGGEGVVVLVAPEIAVLVLGDALEFISDDELLGQVLGGVRLGLETEAINLLRRKECGCRSEHNGGTHHGSERHEATMEKVGGENAPTRT
mmetsp:Transcript_128750/g.412463  ORF Transcript_128750/g.412463 Transcript_128750/m.412463 type:complete len:412 (+) Transcript_128750:233-1468(+)